MGTAAFMAKNVQPIPQETPSTNVREQQNKDKNYDIDVIQVSNIALAIKNKQHTINVELTLRCQNLPITKTFGSTDSMVVIYKNDDSSGNLQKSNQLMNNNERVCSEDEDCFVEIGRTQIIRNELNPKYIKSFILSFNQEKKEEIEFRIYDITNPKSEDLNQQYLIGRCLCKLDTLVQNQNSELQIGGEGFNFKKKSKSILKINCIQYDGGNSKYEVGLQASGFTGKNQLFFIIEVLKLNQWIPISRSQPIEVKKNSKFKVMQIPYHKFQGQDNSRIKIKVYEITKNKEVQEVGSTDEITIFNIYTSDDKVQVQRVYLNGFYAGLITVYKWRKVIRDSFISYIVNGAHLNLIVAIDFTNSNNDNDQDLGLHNLNYVNGSTTTPGQQSFQGINFKSNQNTHNVSNLVGSNNSNHINYNASFNNQKVSNPYIQAIQEIVGVLQYFNYNNQIPAYGFGAKLPPFYKSVGNCFALNGNFFNPSIVGGVDELIKYYKENLRKVKLHGPTKLSQVLDLAIEYAQSEPQSPNYYVLVVLTDGQINDFDDTVDKIVRASTLPLSIVLVGLGDKDFSLFQQLDSDSSLLKSPRTGEVCQRDIVDFIKLENFRKDKASTDLARETFAEIPSQFIDYMNRNNIKPNREKKSLKAAKAQFISQKIKENKKSFSHIHQLNLLMNTKQMQNSGNINFASNMQGTGSINANGQTSGSLQQNMKMTSSNIVAKESLSGNQHFSYSNQNILNIVPAFLEYKKKKMRKDLINLGFDSQDPLLETLDIAMNDLSYFIQVHSQKKVVKTQTPRQYQQEIHIRQTKKLQEYLERKDIENKKKTLEKLEKIQSNQFGRKIKNIKKKEQIKKVDRKPVQHPCLICQEKQIQILHTQCGHASVCYSCRVLRCPLCNFYNQRIIRFYVQGDEQLEKQNLIDMKHS